MIFYFMQEQNQDINQKRDYTRKNQDINNQDNNQDIESDSIRAFAYLCPQCGKIALAARDSFALLASNWNPACSCGKSNLNIQFDGSFFHFQVPCGLCGEIHAASCTPDRILKATAAFNCPNTGDFCCFAGDAKQIQKRLPELESLSLSLSRAAENNQNNNLNQNASPFLNDIIMYEILSELRDIAARPNGIQCQCGSKLYKMRVRRASVDFICQDCGGRLRIPAASDQDLDDLCCHMRLVIPGKSP